MIRPPASVFVQPEPSVNQGLRCRSDCSRGALLARAYRFERTHPAFLRTPSEPSPKRGLRQILAVRLLDLLTVHPGQIPPRIRDLRYSRPSQLASAFSSSIIEARAPWRTRRNQLFPAPPGTFSVQIRRCAQQSRLLSAPSLTSVSAFEHHRHQLTFGSRSSADNQPFQGSAAALSRLRRERSSPSPAASIAWTADPTAARPSQIRANASHSSDQSTSSTASTEIDTSCAKPEVQAHAQTARAPRTAWLLTRLAFARFFQPRFGRQRLERRLERALNRATLQPSPVIFPLFGIRRDAACLRRTKKLNFQKLRQLLPHLMPTVDRVQKPRQKIAQITRVSLQAATACSRSSADRWLGLLVLRSALLRCASIAGAARRVASAAHETRESQRFSPLHLPARAPLPRSPRVDATGSAARPGLGSDPASYTADRASRRSAMIFAVRTRISPERSLIAALIGPPSRSFPQRRRPMNSSDFCDPDPACRQIASPDTPRFLDQFPARCSQQRSLRRAAGRPPCLRY